MADSLHAEVELHVADLEGTRAAVDVAVGAALAAGGGSARLVKDISERPWKARDFRLADPDGYFLRITTPLGR